jgi:chaperonin GroES
MVFKALGTRLTIAPDPAKEHNSYGLELPESSVEKPVSGTVLTIGPKVSPDIKVGDRVVYNQYGATIAEVDGEKVCYIRETDCILIIEQ